MEPNTATHEHRPLLDETVRELLASAAERNLPCQWFVVRHLKLGGHNYGDFRITIEQIPESNL